ncbi:hypothetical protein K5D56_04440 [Pseudomonas cichorii]|nr:hypothetical protein [Pseudomonas cichorii]
MSILTEYEFLSWAFGGVGVSIVGWLFKKVFLNKKNKKLPLKESNTSTATGNNLNLNLYTSPPPTSNAEGVNAMNDEEKFRNKKLTTKILFVDDEVKFKVVKIIQNSGWINTQLIKDVRSLDQLEITDANIIFVDIQGVGIELNFKEEGLGLAAALKERYPNKKIIIYSAEQKGDRFHKVLRQVDGSLPKDADPYQFQSLVEEFA